MEPQIEQLELFTPPKREPKIHRLKTWPDFFRAIEEGRKSFEIRINDRDFRVGDEVLLLEYSPARGEYLGGVIHRKITFILTGGMGLRDGYCAFELGPLEKKESIDLSLLTDCEVKI